MLAMISGACAARAQASVPLDDFEGPLGDRWAFSNGPEFAGATGSFERSEDAGHEGAGGHLSFDFTGGGAYVQAMLRLPDEPALGAIELWVRKPVANRMTARAVDEQGQTFQKSFNFPTRGWQKLRVRLDGWSFSWGGPADGVFHGRPTAFGLLVEKGEAVKGAVDFDDLVGIPRAGGETVGLYEPDYIVTEFGPEDGWGFGLDGPWGASTRDGGSVHYDFSAGATAVHLGNDLSILGKPKQLELEVESDGSGHEVRVTLYSHFQRFEKTLGRLEQKGPMTMTAPQGDMKAWEHSGGENDGIARLPLRVGRISLVRNAEGPEKGDVVFRSLSARTEVPPAEALFPVARPTRMEDGRPAFELTVDSLASEPLDGTVTVRFRDFSGRVLSESDKALQLPPGARAEPLRVPAPADDLPFVEASFTVAASGQKAKAATATLVHDWPDPGGPEPQPASPWGMGLYLYRYANSPDGLRDMDRAAALAQAAGIKWSREEFSWGRIEPRQGEFDWSFYDQVVETAERHGISVYGLIDYWSGWTEAYTDEGVEDYCRYAQALVRRYGDRIKHWEIWNEPNIFFWSGPKELYFRLLDRAYAAIKEVDPEAVVFGCSTAGIDTAFIKRTMEAGAHFDGLTIHPYRGSLDDEAFVKELRDVADLVAQDGVRPPVWITEMGWSTQIGGTSERDQANRLARCYLDAVASGAIGNVSWYDFREDGANPYYNEHHFGIVRRDFSPKPAYRAAAAVCRTIGDAQPLAFEKWEEGVFACRFSREPKEVIAAWSTEGAAIVEFDGAPAGMSALNIMGEPVAIGTGDRAATVLLPPGTPVLMTVGQGHPKPRVSLIRVVLGESGLHSGSRTSVSVERDGRAAADIEVSWQLPVGWELVDGEAGRRELRAPNDAAAGPYELVAVARVDGAEIVLPVTVEIVPDVVEV